MLDHVSITVGDLDRAARFYDAIMDALGYPCVYRTEDAIGYGERSTPEADSHSYLKIALHGGSDGGDRHWALRARDHATVVAFHEAALRSGGRDDGPPGPRPDYHATYFAAFVLDPDGNRIEAVCHRP